MIGEYNRPIRLFAQEAPLECMRLVSENLNLCCRSRIGMLGAFATWVLIPSIKNTAAKHSIGPVSDQSWHILSCLQVSSQDRYLAQQVCEIGKWF